MSLLHPTPSRRGSGLGGGSSSGSGGLEAGIGGGGRGGSRRRRSYTGARVMFHLTLTITWLVIGLIWVITPLAWLYVLWTLITLAPSLQRGGPSTSHLVFRVLHYLTLSYCAFEIPFSIVYRLLAIRANRRRKAPQYSRQFLRSVFRRALESGMDVQQVEEDVLQEMGLEDQSQRGGKARGSAGPSLRRSSTTEQSRGGRPDPGVQGLGLRNRSATQIESGDGSRTPEVERHSLEFARKDALNGGQGEKDVGVSVETEKVEAPIKLESIRQPTITADDDDDEGYGASIRSARNLRPRSASYTPSFMEKIEPDDPRGKDFRDYIRLWFNGCDYKDIYRLNMADWLAWSLYSSTLEELEDERRVWVADGKPPLHLDGEPDIDQDGLELEQDKLGLVEHCLDLIEFRAGMPFKEGRNPRCKVIRLTLDPVKVTSRPILLYALVTCLQKSVALNMKRQGFREIKDGDTRYLVRIPKDWKPNRDCSESTRPLLFLHGLGSGLSQYASLLSFLASAKNLRDRPIVVLIQPHISMSIFSRNYLNPPSQTSMKAGISRMAKRWGFDVSGMTILSHSNGSIVHGWICKDLPDLVVRSCFVDPVCFQLWEPWVCYNFLYAAPKLPLDYLMRYFVSRELGVALMLQRSFDWSSNLLFPTNIPRVTSPYHAAFYLAGRDSILHAERIRAYLKRFGIREVQRGESVSPARGGLKVHHTMKHGESMIGSGMAFEQIMSWVTAEFADGADSTYDSSH